MLSIEATLFFYSSKKMVSLRAKRGNPLKTDIIFTFMTSFENMRLPRFARNDHF